MGICFSEKENSSRQRIMKSNKTYLYSDNKVLKTDTNNNNSNMKLHQPNEEDIEFQKENDYHNDGINNLNLLNKPLEYLTNSINLDFNKDTKKNSSYDILISKFKRNIKNFPFADLSSKEIEQYLKDYMSSKMEAPYKFIRKMGGTKLFVKTSEICFLKCEPLLNNINENKNITNLLFLRTVTILLSEENLNNIVYENFNTLIQSSFENENRIFNKSKIIEGIRNYCEICYQIIFYFILGINEFTEEQYLEFLSNENILLENKFNNAAIDDFCLNKYFGKNENTNKMEEIINQWEEFVCKDIEKINEYQSYRNSENKNDKYISNSIKVRFAFMSNSYNLLRIIGGFKLPEKDE